MVDACDRVLRLACCYRSRGLGGGRCWWLSQSGLDGGDAGVVCCVLSLLLAAARGRRRSRRSKRVRSVCGTAVARQPHAVFPPSFVQGIVTHVSVQYTLACAVLLTWPPTRFIVRSNTRFSLALIVFILPAFAPEDGASFLYSAAAAAAASLDSAASLTPVAPFLAWPCLALPCLAPIFPYRGLMSWLSQRRSFWRFYAYAIRLRWRSSCRKPPWHGSSKPTALRTRPPTARTRRFDISRQPPSLRRRDGERVRLKRLCFPPSAFAPLLGFFFFLVFFVLCIFASSGLCILRSRSLRTTGKEPPNAFRFSVRMPVNASSRCTR